MATKKSQRIGIWIIAIVMLIGTLGSFAVMVLGTENQAADLAKQQEMYKEYEKMLKEKQKKADELSVTYYDSFKEYESKPATFDPSTVGDEVTTTDLKQGDGAEIKTDTKYQAYYIGWNPKGKVFDSSIDGDKKKLKPPIDTSESSLIEGWAKGIEGMKVGGVREITIPSDLAYGEKGSGDTIPPNTPIKFIVMVIATK